MCREEALGLSSLRPQLDASGVPLYAVAHEALGVADFQPFFKGEIYLDKERRFYGPVERRMMWSGLLRWSVISNILRTRDLGVEGNLKGEGRILGSVFVIGPGSQGILYEHREKEFGDKANTTQLLEAVLKVNSGNTPKSKM